MSRSSRIWLQGARHARAEVHPDRLLAVGHAGSEPLPGVATKDPAFGLPALWIEEGLRERACAAGYAVIDPVTALLTHLGEVLRRDAALLLTRAQVVALLEGVRARQPGLIEELIPAVMTVSDVQRVLQNLLAEQVPIRNIDLIAETLVDVGRGTKDHSDLTEMVRQRLHHVICGALGADGRPLSVLSLHPAIEAQVADCLRQGDPGNPIVLEPRLAERLVRGLAPLAEAMAGEGLSPVLLCGVGIRRHLRAFLRRSLPRLAVISVAEVPHTIELRSYAVLAAEEGGVERPDAKTLGVV